MKNLFSFYINSSIHVSLAVVALALVTVSEFNLPFSMNLLFFIFFGSITAYNFVKYAGVAKLHHRSLAKWLKLIQVFSFFCCGLFVYFVLQISFQTFLVACFFGLLTLLYALPIFPNKKNLRSFKGMKIFIIALVWAGTTVLLPIFDAEMEINKKVFLEFFQRILFILAVMIPFEIRDLKYDDSLLKTFPQGFGVSNSRKIGYMLLFIAVALEVFQNSGTAFFIAFAFVAVLTGILIYKSTRAQHQYYASFWVESVPIFWLGLILLLQSVGIS